MPAKGEDVVYISSGTWSLMGVERKEPDCSLDSMKADLQTRADTITATVILETSWAVDDPVGKKGTDRRSELWGNLCIGG